MAPSAIVAPRNPDKIGPKEQAEIDSETAYFRPIPLAEPTLNDPTFNPIYISRALTHNKRGHTLMAGTFNTPETIAHLLSLFRSATSPSELSSAEVRRFYAFGSGLNAHADLLHGGVIASVLDSTMSNAAGLVLRDILGLSENESVMTAQLNVKFEKPVITPGTVMVRAWADKVEGGGRKIWVRAECVGGERGEVSHGKAEGLWLKAKFGKL